MYLFIPVLFTRKVIIATHSYTAYGNEHSRIRHAWVLPMFRALWEALGNSITFWALSGPSCTHAVSQLAGMCGESVSAFDSPIPWFSVKICSSLTTPTPIQETFSNLQRWEFSPFVSCQFLLLLSMLQVSTHCPTLIWPFGSKLGLFSGQSLADKISTRTGKRAGMEADTEAADLFLPEALFIFHE